MFYKYTFDGNYHIKEDGSHDVKLIQRDENGNETAFCEGEAVPSYGIEITAEEMPSIGE